MDKTHNKEYIGTLLRKFMDGESTLDEEKKLSGYFRTEKNIPEEWEDYREMFALFDHGMSMGTGAATGEHLQTECASHMSRVRNNSARIVSFVRRMAMPAGVALVFMTLVITIPDARKMMTAQNDGGAAIHVHDSMNKYYKPIHWAEESPPQESNSQAENNEKNLALPARHHTTVGKPMDYAKEMEKSTSSHRICQDELKKEMERSKKDLENCQREIYDNQCTLDQCSREILDAVMTENGYRAVYDENGSVNYTEEINVEPINI